jgi:hypothetical protein
MYQGHAAAGVSVKSLKITTLPGRFAVCRLGPDDAVPGWARGAFVSITRTAEELSVICDEAAVPDSVRAERGWVCFQVLGPIPFETVGVAAAISTALADAGISVFMIATFDTDYVLVKHEASARAIEVLQKGNSRQA